MMDSSTTSRCRPLKIGYVLKRYPRFSETFVVNEILAHEAAGTEIEIFALRPSVDTHYQPAIAQVRGPVRYLTAASVRATELWSRLAPWLARRPDCAAWLGESLGLDGTELHQALELATWIQRQGIDHLHAHFATSAATVARVAARLAGITYSVTAHAKDIYDAGVDPDALAQKLGDADAVITVSQYNVAHLQQAAPASRGKLHCLYNGLPLDSFPLVNQPPVDQTPLILAVGRLVEKKGFDDLVQACATLCQRGHHFNCEIVGGGEHYRSLHDLVSALDLHDCVRLRGPLSSDGVRQLMARATMMVAPCVTSRTGDRDGMPTVLLEAMATGTPCVATTVSGIPELITPGESGLLIPERSPLELAIAMEQLLGDESLRDRFRQQGRLRIERDFDGQVNAARQRDIFAHCGRAVLLAEAG